MTELQRSTLQPEDVHAPTGKYSHAIRARGGELLIMAGQVPIDPDGNLVGEGNIVVQTAQVFKNIEAVLKAGGGDPSDVAEFTYYIVGRENVQPFVEARTAVFDQMYPTGEYPPATLLLVEGLANEAFMLEVSVLAILA